MAKNNSVIEDALFQIKNLEESLNKNAQGILSSTMKNEIKSLVKESLKEQDEVEDEDVDVEETDTDNEDEMGTEEEGDEIDVETEGLPTMGLPPAPMDSEEDETIDLTKASDSEVLRVFKAMGDEDGIIIKKDDDMLHLSDPSKDVEYLIQLGESEDELSSLVEFEDEDIFDYEEEDLMEFDDMDLEMEDDTEFMEGMDFEMEDDLMEDDDYDFEKGLTMASPMSEMDDMYKPQKPNKSVGETIYELELEDDDLEMMEGMDFMDDEDMYIGNEEEIDDTEFMESEDDVEEMIQEAFKKVKMKTKGIKTGNASKFKYAKKPNQDYKPKKMKQGTRGVGMGKAKFEYKEDVNKEGFGKKPHTPKKKVEAKEASRTYGNGSKEGRGLRKGITPNRNLTFENVKELSTLRAKNDEYRKALDLFRTKLNEVAIFNSNLAYATRLFTEHSTTKQEKINILRRFDNVETLKESKNLYKNIKNELSSSKVGGENTITESVQRTVSKVPTTGSAVSLIESKTYENPQFMRMKDLMGKLK